MSDFTADQASAIEYLRRDACVVAGPGSGKTTVLVERYRRLIEDHGFEPRQILAITFTEKAAANMKAKVAEKFAHDEQRLRELELAWISTIHGFCARFLRENAIAAGIDPKFTVLDARQSDDLQFECLNTALDELVLERRTEALSLLEALQTARIVDGLKDAYDGMRSAGMTVDDVRSMESPGVEITHKTVAARMREILKNWPSRPTLTKARQKHYDELSDWAQQLSEGKDIACPLRRGSCPESSREELADFKDRLLPAFDASKRDLLTAHFRNMIFDVLSRFETLYQEKKNQRGALDFNDLERRAIDLLRRDEAVRSKYGQQFRQVMLDEFQDINEQQAELIRLIRAEDVFFAVGDINQSIYGFRHARPQIFCDYREEIEAGGKQSAKLLDNFRSRADILKCVEGVLNGAAGIEANRLTAARKFSLKEAASVEILRVIDDEDEETAGIREARWIAYRILQLRQNEHEFHDFAVLCRSHDAMQPIMGEFDLAGIPYICGRRQSFLLSREGLDIRALLAIIDNPLDSIALATVLRSSLVGIGDEAILQLRTQAGSLTAGLNLVARDAARLDAFAEDDRRKLQRFIADLKRWRTSHSTVSLDLMIVRMLSDCGFDWTAGTTAGTNIELFLKLARTTSAERSIGEFLRELDSVEKAVSAESELSDQDQGNAVQVMTAHAAKGLEFPVTIVAAMHKAAQNGSGTITFTPEHGIGLRWKEAKANKHSHGIKDSWALANSGRLKQREMEEENRLLYVAMTRAEEHLILSYTRDPAKRPTGWAKLVEDYLGPENASCLRQVDTDPPVLTVQAMNGSVSAVIPALPAPQILEQQDSAVNVTSLAVFAGCPRKYYLQRYIGWSGGRMTSLDPEELPGDSDLSASEIGSSVHEVLAGKPGSHPAEAIVLANVFRDSDLGQRAAASRCAEREWEFIADMGGTLVRGSVDLWFEENGEIQLVDYKTDVLARPAEYAPQLALYALAIERAFGRRPTHAYLHFLRPNIVAEVPLDERALEQAKRSIEELGRAQDSLDFELREGSHCYSCPFYRSMCPAQA